MYSLLVIKQVPPTRAGERHRARTAGSMTTKELSMNMKRLRAVTAIGSLTLTIAACGGGSEAASGEDGGSGPTTVRVAHNSNAANLPARIAGEKGYFSEDCGFDVEFTTVENIASLPPALGRSFEIVQTAPTNMIQASAQGIAMVAAAGATVDVPENPTAGVITTEGSGITSVEQLEGKTLGVLNETGTLHTATKFWLQESGVPLDSVEILQIDGPAQADQLLAGRVDAVETVAPFRGTILAREGTVDLGDPYLQMAPEIGAILWGAQRQWAEENSETVECFRASLEKAIDDIASDDALARSVLKEYTGLPDDIVTKTVFPTYISDVRPQDLEAWLEALRAVEDFDGDVALEDLVLDGE
jgi:NitT/TauT family transport system substrate-binding protein